MEITNIHEAKTHFSRLLARVAKGEEIIIGKAGKPVAKLVKFTATKPDRKGGQLRGKIWMSENFDAPLPEEIAKAFRGEGTFGEDK